MIPAGVIEDLKFRNNIEDVIGQYVTLKRAGSNLKGLCPFHSEKTPSFTVYTGEGAHFHCYGCGAGGDVVSFVMRIENLDYVPALQFLAKRCGVTLPEDDAPVQGVSRKRILEMNLCAARFFREQLFSPAGAPGQEYFAARGLSGATIKHFGLGYAPDTFDALKKHLRREGYTDEEMVTGDLCKRSQKDQKHIYDTFRGRVIFPIIDVSGNVIAFGGRVLGVSEIGMKYYNSGDTPAFKKGKNLFALNYARNHAADGFILCEGYMDVIALHAAGFENAVATLGTAITPEQARILRKYTDKVTVSYDSDEAGQRAADKALRLLDEAGIEAKVLNIPGAKDPDEYIKKFGKENFAKVLSGSKAPFEHKINRALAKYDISTPEGKSRAARELCYALAELPSRIDRDIYAARAAQVLDLGTESIKAETAAILRKKAAARKKEQSEKVLRQTSGISDRINPDRARQPASGALEQIVLGMLLAYHKEFIQSVIESGSPTAEDFFTSLNRRLFETILACHAAGGFDFAILSEYFTADEVSTAAEYMDSRRRLSDNSAAVFADAVGKLKAEAARIRARESGEMDLKSFVEGKRKK